MKNDKCTVLVSSCDQYEDLWTPFFICLKRNWKELNYPIVLNTESKKYQFEGLNIKTFQLYKTNEKVAWGRRLRETLKKIESEYVILLLDDFFLKSPVDIKRLEQCIMWMDQNKNIANFSFFRTHGNNEKSKIYTDFEKRAQNGEYRFNCQAAIWRRKRLIKFIRNHESPWDWELLGSIRSRRYKDEFYSIIEGRKPIFDYYTGGALHRGRWVLKCVQPLIEEYALDIDLNKRGYQEDYNTVIDKVKEDRTFSQKVRGRINYYITKIKSLI